MRIFINRRPVDGPWGGGSKVIKAITDEARKRGHDVTHDASIPSDLILCVDPRADNDTNFGTLLEMKKRDKSLLVQRVGDLGYHGKPDLLDLVRKASQFADYIIFPSNWAKIQCNVSNFNTCVIQNAPLDKFIRPNAHRQKIDGIKIVSHHWSDNIMKGFSTYQALDQFCQERENYKFTFIGRKPPNIELKNYVSPQDSNGLVDLLPKNNLYVTASKKEAGANHVLEAIGLGLPVLYHVEGGSINEYCQNYGLQYKDDDELMSLISDSSRMKKLIEDMPAYGRNASLMAAEYIDLFESLYENKH